MKKYLIFAASALALASCSSDDFLGENPGNVQNATTAINFGGDAGKTTRANKTRVDAANALQKHFVVYGDKTNDTGTQAVYDHYDVKWIGDEADKKTQTNQHGWEYVGYTPNKNSNLATDATQSIKYWDYSASEYNFAAFSLGELTSQTENNPYENQVDKNATTIGSGKVKISQIESKATKYTIEGSAEAITNLYISDRVTAKPSNATKPDINYKDAVEFNFRALKSQVRMGIFEIIPGYSVKDVKFYSSSTSTTATETPSLYAKTNSIPAGEGKATVTFGASGATDYNKAKVEWESQNNVEYITFGDLSKKKEEAKEEAGTTYIGRTANDASLPTNYTTVIPSTGIGALTLKVDYTLVSTDGSKEEIKVTGATAVVPAEYTKWQPNYSYTYIFKISDKTNGNTGDPTKPGLYPIVFDAVVTETENGIQNTITTVDDPSITTYAKGALSAEYDKGANIYVSCSYNDLNLTNCALYTVTANDMNITEASVANCLVNGKKDETNNTWTIGDDSKNLVVTAATGLLFVNNIDASDTPDGKVINSDYGFIKFTAATAGTYAFEYTHDSKKYYKLIKVKDVTPAP